MIVVDTSALVAMFLREEGFETVRRRIAQTVSLIPVSVYVEFLLLKRLRDDRVTWLDRLLSQPNMSVCSLDIAAVEFARQAALNFGKGSGHPAALNFGDCLSYAVAKQRGLPLLFTGNDFLHTDIESVL